jgi:hypothetical protein
MKGLRRTHKRKKLGWSSNLRLSFLFHEFLPSPFLSFHERAREKLIKEKNLDGLQTLDSLSSSMNFSLARSSSAMELDYLQSLKRRIPTPIG